MTTDRESRSLFVGISPSPMRNVLDSRLAGESFVLYLMVYSMFFMTRVWLTFRLSVGERGNSRRSCLGLWEGEQGTRFKPGLWSATVLAEVSDSVANAHKFLFLALTIAAICRSVPPYFISTFIPWIKAGFGRVFKRTNYVPMMFDVPCIQEFWALVQYRNQSPSSYPHTNGPWTGIWGWDERSSCHIGWPI